MLKLIACDRCGFRIGSVTSFSIVIFILNILYRRAKEKAKAGRVSLAKATSFVDELKEEEHDDGALHNIIKTEALSTDLLLRDETSSELLDASPSPLSDTNPPSHAPSPPELRVITDSAVFNWTNNEVNEPPPDSATSCTSSSLPAVSTCTALPNNCLDLDSEDLYALRRGSLPVTSALYSTQVSHIHPSDPIVRRCSVDASLQRLALHPYANLARAKNTALYGPGVGVASSDSASHDVPSMSADGPSHYHLMNSRHYSPHRLQRRFVSSSALSAVAQYGSSLPTAQYSNMRRLSMDSRALRISSLQRMRHSPSPSPLSTYSSISRSSLPESHLYSMAARPVGSPIPGPLPMPGFQFGAASTSTPSMASPSSVDSERNSPDSIRSFSFCGDEENYPSPSYETYTSRFSSVVSIATSESSLNSAYYGGSIVDQDRRPSTWYVHIYLTTLGYCTDIGDSTPQYYAPPADLDGGRPDGHNLGTGEDMSIPTAIVVGYSPPEEYASYGGADELPLSISDMRRLQQAQSEPLLQHQAYVSPSTPAISTTGEIHGPHEQDAPSMPISTSSELAFALESKPPELVSNMSCDLLNKPFDIPVWRSRSTVSRKHQHQKHTSILVLMSRSPKALPSIIMHNSSRRITQRKFRHTTEISQPTSLHTHSVMTCKLLSNLLTLGYTLPRVITRIHWALHPSPATIFKLQTHSSHIPESAAVPLTIATLPSSLSLGFASITPPTPDAITKDG